MSQCVCQLDQATCHECDWRYLVGFVHPVSGRTVWHLATTVNSELFSLELAAFAREVGAGPAKQIVLVLDGAGWHDSPQVRVPEHVHLLFLPPHSPELQPAEHLWSLTNTVLVNRHFASIDELEDAQAERCVALQARPDLIRSTTRFHWWPKRIAGRRGPRRLPEPAGGQSRESPAAGIGSTHLPLGPCRARRILSARGSPFDSRRLRTGRCACACPRPLGDPAERRGGRIA